MDIREKLDLTHEDITSLDFISSNPPYIFRKHYNQGLRSHIMQVIRPEEYKRESSGELINGQMDYSIARPSYMLRIFKSKVTKDEALNEIQKLKIMREYLKESMAHSNEFIAAYNSEPILCGLQEYIQGDTIDPWFCVPASYDNNFSNEMNKFIDRVKKTIHNTGYVPDLAGNGNLVYSKRGVVLTDMNNINRIDYSQNIFFDDKGFPIIDISIEALSNLERAVNGSAEDKLYDHFLEPQRREQVSKIRRYWRKEDKPFMGAH
ncbi:MAG: hypothetical protein ACOCZ6_06150 [Nanoarchaeota archaeon]